MLGLKHLLLSWGWGVMKPATVWSTKLHPPAPQTMLHHMFHYKSAGHHPALFWRIPKRKLISMTSFSPVFPLTLTRLLLSHLFTADN